MNVKLEYYYNLLNRESPYKYINEIIGSLILKILDLIIPTGLVRLEDKNSLSQSYSLPSIDLIANQEKRSSLVVSFTGFKSPLLIIN